LFVVEFVEGGRRFAAVVCCSVQKLEQTRTQRASQVVAEGVFATRDDPLELLGRRSLGSRGIGQL
jgi:hypothetical protein